jgi:hypothetical protein
VAGVLALAAPAQTATTPWLAPGWSHRYAIAIADVPTDGAPLRDFVLLVQRAADPALAAHAHRRGRDLRFVDVLAGAACAHELAAFDAASGAFTAWVRVPRLAAHGPTVLHLYFGNDKAPPQAQPAQTWRDYEGVWHLEETVRTGPGEVRDSSPAGNHGTATAGLPRIARTAGAVGHALALAPDGIAATTIDLGDVRLPPAYTLSAWIRCADPAQPCSQIVFAAADLALFLEDHYACAGHAAAGFRNASSWPRPVIDGERWHHLAATFAPGGDDDGQGELSLFVDGTLLRKLLLPAAVSGAQARLGNDAAGRGPLRGSIDEVRLCRAARTPAFVRAEFQNQRDPAGFCRFGDLEPEPAARR